MKPKTKATLLLIVFDVLIVLSITYMVGLAINESRMPLWYMFSWDTFMVWMNVLGFAGPIVLGYAMSWIQPFSAAGLIQKIIFVGSSTLIVLYSVWVLYGLVAKGIASAAPQILY